MSLQSGLDGDNSPTQHQTCPDRSLKPGGKVNTKLFSSGNNINWGCQHLLRLEGFPECLRRHLDPIDIFFSLQVYQSFPGLTDLDNFPPWSFLMAEPLLGSEKLLLSRSPAPCAPHPLPEGSKLSQAGCWALQLHLLLLAPHQLQSHQHEVTNETLGWVTNLPCRELCWHLPSSLILPIPGLWAVFGSSHTPHVPALVTISWGAPVLRPERRIYFNPFAFLFQDIYHISLGGQTQRVLALFPLCLCC